MKKTKAFTLAEILITLTVIGIVAVMTVSVIQNVIFAQEQKAQFKKVITTVENAIAGIKVNNGVYPNCYYAYNGSATNWTECLTVFYPELKKNLNIAKECV